MRHAEEKKKNGIRTWEKGREGHKKSSDALTLARVWPNFNEKTGARACVARHLLQTKPGPMK